MFSPEVDDRKLEATLNEISNAYQCSTALNPSLAVLECEVKPKDYRDSIFPTNTYNDENLAERAERVTDNQEMMTGQGIANNNGVLMNSLSRIPSYQWSFRHEDDHHSTSHHGNNHHSHHKRYILSGLGPYEGSVGSSAPSVAALHAKLMRMPIKSEATVGKERSIMNGLPYYDKSIVDAEIRALNMEKPVEKINHHESMISTNFNDGVDDLEYLHGEVVLNKFLANKRILRDYQWLLYYANRRGGKPLDKSSDLRVVDSKTTSVSSLRQYQEFMRIRHDRLVEAQETRAKIAQRCAARATAKKIREESHDESDANLDFHDELGDFLSSEALNDHGKKSDEEAIEQREREEEAADKKLEDSLPVFADEIVVEKSTHNLSTPELPRFAPMGPIVNPDREIVIQRELPVDDRELIEYEQQVCGIVESNRLIEQAEQSHGIIRTKRITTKRVPNANALGYSNIRRRRPAFIE